MDKSDLWYYYYKPEMLEEFKTRLVKILSWPCFLTEDEFSDMQECLSELEKIEKYAVEREAANEPPFGWLP